MELKTKVYGAVLLVAFVMSGFSGAVSGQTFGEFFNQKKTQQRYLLVQIAALQVYIGQAKKGYDLVGYGLSTIKDFSNGEFGLHNTFITSLKMVSPQIRNHIMVTQVITDQALIVKALNRLKGTGGLIFEDQQYIQEVKAGVIEECLKDLEEFALVVISGKVAMTTDQRILRLDKVCQSMREKLEFILNFCEEVQAFALAKEYEIQSINKLKYHYGIIE